MGYQPMCGNRNDGLVARATVTEESPVSEQTKKPVRPRSRKRVMALLLTAGVLSVVSALTTPPQTRATLVNAVRERLGGQGKAAPSDVPAGPARESVVAEGRFATYPGAEVVVSAE